MVREISPKNSHPPIRMIKTSSLEYTGALFLIVFGIWVLSWGPDGAISSAAFDTLRASFAKWDFGKPFRVAGLLAVFVGLFYVVAININGRGMMWTPIVRGTACVFAVSFFLNVSFNIYSSQHSSTGVITYAALSYAYAALFVLNLDRFVLALEIIWGEASHSLKAAWRRVRGLDLDT